MNQTKKLSTVVIILLIPILALVLSLRFHPPYILSILLFYGVPAIYLLLNHRTYIFALKDLIYTVIVATPFAIIVDYIGAINGLWFVPQSFFSHRLFGIIPFEDFFWMFTGTYLIVILYQTFSDRSKKEFIDYKMVRFIIPAAVALGLFFTLIATHYHELLWSSRYTYLVLCSIFFLLPAGLFLVFFPRFLKKSLTIMGYFLYTTVLFEFTATYLEQWVFPGRYLFQPFSFFGLGLVPIEELFFVGVVAPVAAIAFYEFFDDDLS